MKKMILVFLLVCGVCFGEIRGRYSGKSPVGGVSFIIAADDSPAEWKSKADYIADGTSDEVQINLALASLGSLGGSVLLSPGNFAIAATIVIEDNTILLGSGDSTKINVTGDIGATVITNADATPLSRSGTPNFNITVRDLFVEGNKSQQTTLSDDIWCVGFSTVVNLLVENIHVNNGFTASIRTEFCTDVVICNNKVVDSADDAIAINNETTRAKVYGNDLKDTGVNGVSYGSPAGIEVQDGSNDVVVFGNTIVGYLADGLQVSNHIGKDGCSKVSFTNNTVSKTEDVSTATNGIRVSSADSAIHTLVIINNNTFADTSPTDVTYAINVSSVTDLQISGNSVSGNGYGGRSQGAITQALISNNTFRNITGTGNAFKGFLFGNTNTDIIFSNNTVAGFNWMGIEADGVAVRMKILNNIFEGMDRVGGSEASTGQTIGFENTTATDCEFSGNLLDGVNWSYDDNVSVINVWGAGWTGHSNQGQEDYTYDKIAKNYKNTSGSALALGEVVVLKAVAAGNEVTTTTTQGDDKVIGIALGTIDNDAFGQILTEGETVSLKVDGTDDIAVGDYIGTFTTADISMKAATGDMAFAIAKEAYTTDDSSGVIDAILITPRKL